MGIEEMEIDYIRKYAYQQDRNYNQKHEKFSKKKKWCELHKGNTHTTNECALLKNLGKTAH
ncbi:hypothetical protein GVAV_000910 [Gurleya vavrai]